MAEQNEINYKAAAAEFIAMMFFVYVGCGSATSNAGNDGWVLLVALSFGMGTMVQLSFDHLNSSRPNVNFFPAAGISIRHCARQRCPDQLRRNFSPSHFRRLHSHAR